MATLIAAALPEELTRIRSGVPEEVRIVETGDGADRAARCLASALDADPDVDTVLVVGFAGALDPELVVGEVVVAETVRGQDGPIEPPPDANWRQRLLAAGARAAPVASSLRLVSGADVRAQYRRLVQAAAVDLESAALARVSADRGLSYAVVRAITDGASETLPAALLRAERRDGSIDRSRVVRGALLCPWRIPSLLGLRRRARAAADNLARTVIAALRHESSR